jgi:NAD(P)-dependent dehydrogenase (short-subunit alcohol dehydrogenase family)
MNEFNAKSTTDEVIEGISLDGRVAVVTGASAGLGVETARVLAGAGARVLLVGRDRDKLAGAVKSLRDDNPQAEFDTALMDLSDLDSVRIAAADIAARYPEIHLLINNAGIMACPFGRTAQGFELQFGTNHLGHFLFTVLLVPSLLAAAAAGERETRVVCLSSAAHRFGGMDFDDPNYEHRDYDKWGAYGQSKTANALFAVALDQRLRDRGVRTFSVHPGVIQTELGRHLTQQDQETVLGAIPSDEYKTVPQGAATSVWAATSPDLEGKGGVYLEDCHIAEPGLPGERGGVQDHAIDPALADRLWHLSEELVDETFDL